MQIDTGMPAEIKYAKSGSLNIAYQIVGKGDRYVVFVPGWISSIEELWNFSGYADFVETLAAHHTVILFDKRGTGLSDRVNENVLPTLSTRIDDLRAILDQENILKTSLIGVSEGGPMALLFAATFPERVDSLVAIGSYACWLKKEDNPHGISLQRHLSILNQLGNNWSRGYGLKGFAPSMLNNDQFVSKWSSFLRKSASPNTAKALYRMNMKIDVRDILGEVRQPCLIIHRKDDKVIPVELGRDLANRIPQSRYLELEGKDHLFWLDPGDHIKAALADFFDHKTNAEKSVSKIRTLVTLSIPGKEVPHSQLNNNLNNSEQVSASNGITIASYRSANEAFADALELQHLLKEHQPKIILHTGTVNSTVHKNEMEGPGRDVSLQIHESVQSHGIWVSDMCRQLISANGIAWPEQEQLEIQNSQQPIRLLRAEEAERSLQLHKLLRHKDSKITATDIETLISIQHYLDQHFQDDPGIQYLSKRFGLNSFKLKYGFKKLFRTSIKQYTLNLRLQLAHQLLQETTIPVAEISRRVGYTQPSSFSRAYFKQYRKLPSAQKRAG